MIGAKVSPTHRWPAPLNNLREPAQRPGCSNASTIAAAHKRSLQVNAAQISGKRSRLRKELARVYESDPRNLGHLRRLEAEIAALERELVAYAPESSAQTSGLMNDGDLADPSVPPPPQPNKSVVPERALHVL
jgi:hypothetical protein